MIQEKDIRPLKLINTYQALCIEDAKKMDYSKFVEISCPGCGSGKKKDKFTKHDFKYVLCPECNSLFCSPRPNINMLTQFYYNSESSKYWSDIFYPEVAETRRKTIILEKARRIKRIILKQGKIGKISICDVGAGYGILLEELASILPSASLFAVEPGKELAEICINKGIETLTCNAEQADIWHNKFDLVLSSEVLEHVFSPYDFIKALHSLIKPGGRLILTGLGYEGFDILMLQDKSRSIFPPCHINLLSIAGYEGLFHSAGFKEIEIFTPGLLDVDIVMNSNSIPEFLKVLSKRDGALKELQKYFQKYKLSSHIWGMGIK